MNTSQTIQSNTIQSQKQSNGEDDIDSPMIGIIVQPNPAVRT